MWENKGYKHATAAPMRENGVAYFATICCYKLV